MTVTLPSTGKPRSILNVTDTVRNSKSVDVVVEGDAASLTLYVGSLGQGVYLDVKVEQLGDASNNNTIIYRFPQVSSTGIEPISTSLLSKGRWRITAEYTGSIDFEIYGKTLSASALLESNLFSVEVSTTAEDRSYRENHLQLLSNIVEHLERILNHQRYITSLEIDAGEKY